MIPKDSYSLKEPVPPMPARNQYDESKAYLNAEIYYSRKNYVMAIQQYDELIKYNYIGIYFNNRAVCKFRNNDLNGAISDLTKAIELEPHETIFIYNRIKVYDKAILLDLELSDKELLEKLISKDSSWMNSEANNIFSNDEVKSSNDIFLNRLGIKYLYHFTLKNNLDSILEHGLLSKQELSSKLQIQYPEIDRVEDERNYNLSEYVRLYFNPRNKFLLKMNDIQQDIVILAIDRKALFTEYAAFSNYDASLRSTNLYISIEELKYLDWTNIFKKYTKEIDLANNRSTCAEALVFKNLPATYIKKIYCNNEFATKAVKYYIRNHPHIDVEINNHLFFIKNFRQNRFTNWI